MTIPALLSPANSPRNAVVGLSLLLLVSADEMTLGLRGRWRRIAIAVLSLLLALTALYGVGTILATRGIDMLPHSSVAPALSQEGVGWREIALDPEGTLYLERDRPVFALDYSIAGQLRYYTRFPVTTAWPQYRLWGDPTPCAAKTGQDALKVVGLTYLDPRVVTARLHESFGRVEGPQYVTLREKGLEKTFQLWEVKDCRTTTEILLERLDFLTLLRAGIGE
jgi:hypothetical protein